MSYLSLHDYFHNNYAIFCENEALSFFSFFFPPFRPHEEPNHWIPQLLVSQIVVSPSSERFKFLTNEKKKKKKIKRKKNNNSSPILRLWS